MRLGRRHRRKPGRGALAAAVVVIGATVAGCSSGDDVIPDSSRASTTTAARAATTTSTLKDAPTTTSGEDPKAQITAAYLAFWEARFKANEDPVNPDDPTLRQFATGSQLENVVAETSKRKADGLAFRKAAQSAGRRDVTVVEISGEVATVQECSVNDGVVYRVATAEVVDGTVVTHSVDGSMRLVDGQWKVESTRLIQKWEGIGGCALSE